MSESRSSVRRLSVAVGQGSVEDVRHSAPPTAPAAVRPNSGRSSPPFHGTRISWPRRRKNDQNKRCRSFPRRRIPPEWHAGGPLQKTEVVRDAAIAPTCIHRAYTV